MKNKLINALSKLSIPITDVVEIADIISDKHKLPYRNMFIRDFVKYFDEDDINVRNFTFEEVGLTDEIIDLLITAKNVDLIDEHSKTWDVPFGSGASGYISLSGNSTECYIYNFKITNSIIRITEIPDPWNTDSDGQSKAICLDIDLKNRKCNVWIEWIYISGN